MSTEDENRQRLISELLRGAQNYELGDQPHHKTVAQIYREVLSDLTSLIAQAERDKERIEALRSEVKDAEAGSNAEYDKCNELEIENTRIEKLISRALGELSRIDGDGISMRDGGKISDAKAFLEEA